MTGSDLEDGVLAANADFYRAFNDKDLSVMAEVWSTRDDISCIHPGWNLLRGNGDVLESWKSILSNPDQPRIVTGSAQVTTAGSAAIVVCRELVGGSPLAATNVYVQEEAGWKLLHHQSGPVSALQST